MQGTTIVFDLDGTLIDTAPDLAGAVNHVLAGLGHAPVPALAIRAEVSHGAKAMLRKAAMLAGATMSDADLDRLYQAELLPFYADNIAVESRPFPGLLAAIDAIERAGARLAVCTNKGEGLSRKLLTELDLAHRFAAIAGRDTFAVMKPHPDHLLGAIRAGGGDPARAVMVGDSTTDVRAARAAGVPVIGVSFGYLDVPVSDLGADRLIGHYDELVGAIGAVTKA